MIEHGKISSFQMAVMMYPTIAATALLILPNNTAHTAGRDMWLSPFWAAMMGLFTVFIAWQLNKLYPKETIIEYSVTICGKWIGKLLGLLFILFYIHINGMIIREYSDFIIGTLLLETPSIVVIGSIVFVCGLAVRGGIEVIARCAEFFGPVVTVLFLVIIILLIPELEPSKMFPMFEHGIKPSLLGAAAPQAWFSEYLLIAFMLPYIVDRDQAFKWATMSVIAVMLILMVTNFAALFLFGMLTENLTYPIMSAARYISIADFFEHIESIVMALWVAGAFIKISVFYYAAVLGTAQFLNLKNYKSIVFPIGMLLALLGFWSFGSFSETKEMLGKLLPFYLPTVQTLIPLLLLTIAMIKAKIASTTVKSQQIKNQ